MQPVPLSTHFIQDVSFVNELVEPQDGLGFGYCFGGDRPGPRALFAAWSPTIDAVSQRLVNLPTFPWMWGHLYLVALDRLKVAEYSKIAGCLPEVSFDAVSVLANPALENLVERDLDAGYWTVLRMCTDLGMIQGRGVRTRNG